MKSERRDSLGTEEGERRTEHITDKRRGKAACELC